MFLFSFFLCVNVKTYQDDVFDQLILDTSDGCIQLRSVSTVQAYALAVSGTAQNLRNCPEESSSVQCLWTLDTSIFCTAFIWMSQLTGGQRVSHI